MKKIKFLNTSVNAISMNECIEGIEDYIEKNQKAYVVPVNVDVIIKIEKDPELKEIVDHADMVLIDGKPLIWIAHKHKLPITEKISGSDLVPRLLGRAAEKGFSVFILGGREGVADKAKQKIEDQLPQIKIVGTYSPYVGFENDQDEQNRIIEKISESKPNILLVCLGCPKQEKFIYNKIHEYDANVSICAGATVDFLAGNVRRAPKWMSNCGLEWLYRFFQEPKRLFKRYFIDDIKIFKLARKYKKNNKKEKRN